jgi:phage baseplate assembly protein W
MPLERVSQGFKDLSMSFQVNPLTNDLIALGNATAISRSIRNIVFTLPGEKFFNPDFGTRLNRILFENMDEISASDLRDQIASSIVNFEPRVTLLDVSTEPLYDQNAFNVTISYKIIGADLPAQEVEFILQPTR